MLRREQSTCFRTGGTECHDRSDRTRIADEPTSGRIFDDQVSVLHRLHDTNVTAADVARHWPRRIADHFSRPKHLRLSATATAFHDTFGCRLDPAMKALIDRFLGLRGASWPTRVRFALNCPVERQLAVDNFILRVVLTLGRI